MPIERTRLLSAVGVVTVLAAGPAYAESASSEEVALLKQQLKLLEQKLDRLEKQSADNAAAAAHANAKAARADTRAAGADAKAANADAKAKQADARLSANAAIPAKAAPFPDVLVKMTNNRPTICTADGANCISITSRLHLDVGGYNYTPNTAATSPQQLNDGVNARRARIGVLGTFMNDWNYALVYDFGGSSDGFGGTNVGSTGGVSLLPGGGTSGVENAYISYTGFKPFGGKLAIEGGYMDVNYTLDEATSSNDIMFMERASSQVIATSMAAGDFRSAVGARWYNDFLWFGGYVTGPTSGAIHAWGPPTGTAGATEQYGATARAAWQVVNTKDYSFHIGGNGEWLLRPPISKSATGVVTQTLTFADRPELRIDPTSIMSTGAIANVDSAQVYSVEAAGSIGSLYVQGEYFWYNIDRIPGLGLPGLNFDGGYIQAGYVLTGERRTYNPATGAYNGVVPNNPFSLADGGLGAWEIAGRVSVMDLNDRLGSITGIAGGKQTVYTAGLNWYVNRNIRFMVNYVHGDIDKQASAVSSSDVGAKFDAVAMRTQVAF